MELKKIPSFQSRSILVPQKTNIEFDIIGNDILTNDTKFKDKTKNSLKRIIQKHQNNGSLKIIPKLIQLENAVINKSLPLPHKIFSDAIIEAFLDNSSTGLIPNDYSESIIFHNRINEEMNRIQQRSHVNLTDEQRQQLVHIALKMDVPKLARRIVKENMELFLESKECSSFLTDSLIIEDISSPENKSSSNFDINSDNSYLNKSKTTMNDTANSNDDAQFCKAFDEVDRIRKRIIEKASFKPQLQSSFTSISSTPKLTTISSSSLINNGNNNINATDGSILIHRSEDIENVTVLNDYDDDNIPKSSFITESNSNSSLLYLESNKVDVSISGTFRAEYFINILDSSKSSDGTIQSMKSTVPSNNVHTNISSTVLESASNDKNDLLFLPTTTTSISKHNEIALSLDSLIGSRSNSMYVTNTNKQKQLGSESLYHLQHQLDCVKSPTINHYHNHNHNHNSINHNITPPSSIGTAMLFNGERTESSLSSENKMFVSPLLNDQYMSSIDKVLLTNDDSSHLTFSPLLSINNTCTNHTILQLPVHPSITTIPPTQSDTSPKTIIVYNMNINKEYLGDDSLSKLIAETEEPNIISAAGKSNFKSQYNDSSSSSSSSSSSAKQDNNNGIIGRMQYIKPPLRSSIDRDSTFDLHPEIDYNNNINNKNDFSYSSVANSIEDGFDYNEFPSKTIHLGAKLLLASPITSWLPSHMNRSIDASFDTTTSKSLKTSIKTTKLSKDMNHFSFSELPMLPKIHQDNDIDHHIPLVSHHQFNSSKMMNKSNNQSSIDHVQKSLLILNEHLSQFDQTTSATSSTSIHSKHRMNESQDKFVAISEYLPSIAQYSKYDSEVPTMSTKRVRTNTSTSTTTTTNIISRHNSNISNASDISSQYSEDAYMMNNEYTDINTPPVSAITQDQRYLLKKTFSNNSIDSFMFNSHTINHSLIDSSDVTTTSNKLMSNNENVNIGMINEIDNVVLNAKSREQNRIVSTRETNKDVTNTTNNTTTSSSSKSRNRIRSCIQESMDMNQNAVNNKTMINNTTTNSRTNNNNINNISDITNNSTNTSMLSKASQRRDALAAALDAGDAVGKLMAEMMIVSNR